MIHIDNVILDKICLHKVGNKVEEEGVIFSKSPLCVNENISKLLVNYFLLISRAMSIITYFMILISI